MGITPWRPVKVLTSRTGAVTRTMGFCTVTSIVVPTATMTVASAGTNVGLSHAYDSSTRPPGGSVSDAVHVDPAGMPSWVAASLAATLTR